MLKLREHAENIDPEAGPLINARLGERSSLTPELLISSMCTDGGSLFTGRLVRIDDADAADCTNHNWYFGKRTAMETDQKKPQLCGAVTSLTIADHRARLSRTIFGSAILGSGAPRAAPCTTSFGALDLILGISEFE